jgi:hypothetical protein
MREIPTTRVFIDVGHLPNTKGILFMSLSPTARLVLHVLRDSPAPLSKLELVAATGASLYTIIPLIQLLARNNMVVRTIIGKTAYYSLPAQSGKGNEPLQPAGRLNCDAPGKCNDTRRNS